MASVTECLNSLQLLTQQNLDILKTLNDSFFTKQNHLVVNINDSKYVIPSFISLENKLNLLQENFYNLVNSPNTGEAYFSIDGNTRAIEVRGYNSEPNSVDLSETSNFYVQNNNIFKDFLTPVPFIKFDIRSISNDINNVVIKKIIPKHKDLISFFENELYIKDNSSKTDEIIKLTSKKYKYSELYKTLALYKKDVDYIEYDTIKRLPIRQNIGHATYVIDSIISDIINEDLENYITIRLRDDLTMNEYTNNLTYKLFNETIEKPLQIGDYLTTYNGMGKVQITNIFPNTNSLEIKVINGEYLNLIGTSQYSILSNELIDDMSKLKFYSSINYDDNKYIDVPLEEDKYVFIAISPLNDRMNIRASWGSGILLNSYELKSTINNEQVSFEKYYDENVRNLGDILNELTQLMSNTLTQFNENEFNSIKNIVPNINSNDIIVHHINQHLSDNSTIKNIKSLYSQKKTYEIELNSYQSKIDNINAELSQISFDDTSNIRSVLSAQLSEYNKKKSELMSSISNIINEISLNANNSTIPIENAKYRIRGFINYSQDLDEVLASKLKAIKVYYRYKNIEKDQGTTLVINDFLYSDWNVLNTINRSKLVSYSDKYIFKLEENNDNKNEPSFNQIDIPINQGEAVDIKVKYIFDYGYPFVEMASQWSDILTIKFPEEYAKDIQVLDIIKENNNEIETNRFNNILLNDGFTDHIKDRINDQDVVFYHKPENIASGFYTAERRVIPLKDKLSEINASILSIQEEIAGALNNKVTVNIVNSGISTELLPDISTNIVLESYSSISTSSGDYIKEGDKMSTVLNLMISNNTNNIIKLYSIFPGSRSNIIDTNSKSKYDAKDYIDIEYKYKSLNINDGIKKQTLNQFILFRNNNPYDGSKYYGEGKLPIQIQEADLDNYKLIAYPYLNNEFAMCMDNDQINTYYTINPNKSVIIPIYIEYKLGDNDKDSSVVKTMSFDLRTSLYEDLTNYTFNIKANYTNNAADKLLRGISNNHINVKYNTTVN